MLQKQRLTNNFIAARVNVRGISWMLKTEASSDAMNSDDSSLIDQQFRSFRLKDQTKKWKKKINRKFQSVGEQIQTNLRHKLQVSEPFDIDVSKQTDPRHTPHLRKSSNFLSQGETLKQQIPDFTIEKCGINSVNKSLLSNKAQKEKTATYNNRSLRLFKGYNQNDPQDQIFQLRKLFAEKRIQHEKISQSRNILKIHQKQKEFIKKQNAQFFGKGAKWMDERVQHYNQFNILNYEKELIKQKFKQSQK